MRYKVAVVTSTTQDPLPPFGRIGSVWVDYQPSEYRDITGQYGPCDPDMIVAECIMDEGVLSTLEANNDYLVLSVEEVPDAPLV